MPNYSSSKNAWPTKNLFVGGGPSRPLQGIRITATKTSTHTNIGPTRTGAKKIFNLAEANFWTGDPRGLSRDKVKSGPFSPAWEASKEGKKYMQSSRGGIAEEKNYKAFFDKQEAERAKLNKALKKKHYIHKTHTR